MCRTLAAALLFALFVAPLASARDLPSGPSSQLDAQLQANLERYGIAGQAVLVAHNGQVLYQGASGERDRATHTPAAVDSIFAAQSMAKLLTSTLVMQLVDQGKVDLDAPASRYVPDLPTAWQAIHVRDFLNHSSGIGEYYNRVDNRWGHADLQTTVGDMNRFLQALATGPLVRTETLEKLWQPQKLSGGGSSFFSTGWDTTRSDGYTQVGHDGGTRVRARLAYKDTLADGYWVFVYLTNGSARTVWSSTLVESTMAVAAPQAFPHAVLSEGLVAYALDDDAGAAQAIRIRSWLRDNNRVAGSELERAINASGYAIRESLGARRALKVFALNTELYPDSGNVWDSLAECHAALGEKEAADQFYAKSKTLTKPSP